jgi:PBP1b-binding outer membrane lipoprotein LpoB
MKGVSVLLLAGFVLVGCQSEAPTTEPAPKTSTSETTKTEPTVETAAKVEPGMSMADVKKILGAPKETKHEHGSGGAELDFWVYADQTVKFDGGKVVE